MWLCVNIHPWQYFLFQRQRKKCFCQKTNFSTFYLKYKKSILLQKQIHIIGSKKDIKNFKDFLSKNKAMLNI